MKYYILIAVSVLSLAANSIITRIFQIKLQKNKHSINLYQALFSAVACVSYFAVAFTGNEAILPNMILPSIAFGGCFSGAILFSAKCMEMGFMSVSSIIMNLSLILPVLYSFIVAKDEITVNTLIGIALILITLILSSLSSNGKNEKSQNMKVWLIFVLIAFFTNGGSAITQKYYQLSYGGDNSMMFMALSYAVSTAIMLTVFLLKNSKSDVAIRNQVSNIGLMIVLAIISGIGSFIGNGLLGFLSDKVNGGILYPCINGGLSIVVSISSFLFFKEKLNAKKLVAIITGLAAIVLLNI